MHRPKYDDWTLPKGKVVAGESEEECALREVLEETGLVCELGAEVAAVHYTDSRGRPKRVRYWDMTPRSGSFSPQEEVDEISWLPEQAARELLTYERDRTVVESQLVARVLES